MFKRTAGVSCSLKESIDGFEIIVCGKMFHCTIVCGKNNHLYVSFCVVICLNVSLCDFLVLLSVGTSMLFGIAIKACAILYIMINLVLRRRSAKVGQPRVSIIEVTLLVLW